MSAVTRSGAGPAPPGLSSLTLRQKSVGAHPGYSRTGLLSSGPRLGGGGISALVLGLGTQLADRLWQACEALTGVTFPGPAGCAAGMTSA